MARTLQALYVHARAQALKANLENSTATLRTLIEQFGSVRDAWREAEGRGVAQNAGQPRTPPPPRRDHLPRPRAENRPPRAAVKPP